MIIILFSSCDVKKYLPLNSIENEKVKMDNKSVGQLMHT